MPIDDYPWAALLDDLDLPTEIGMQWLDPYSDETYLHMGDNYRLVRVNGGFVGGTDSGIPSRWVPDLRHLPTYDYLCGVLADLMGHEGSTAEITRDHVLSNYRNLWCIVVPRGPVGITLVHLHRTEQLETREEALAFALDMYIEGSGPEYDAPYHDEDERMDRMELLMDEEEEPKPKKTKIPRTYCDCDLRWRKWNPYTHHCEACGSWIPAGYYGHKPEDE